MATTSGPKKKITRVSEEYNLSNIGDEMADKWTDSKTGKNFTLAELRDFFNKQVLKKTMSDAGMDLAPGEVDYTYEYLFDEDVSRSDKEDVKRKLESNGVDVDNVESEFINSPQTIHNYLTDMHDVELRSANDDTNIVDKSLNHIESFNERYKKVIENVVKRLVDDGQLPDGEYDINIQCIVTNTDTGTSRDIRDILRDSQ